MCQLLQTPRNVTASFGTGRNAATVRRKNSNAACSVRRDDSQSWRTQCTNFCIAVSMQNAQLTCCVGSSKSKSSSTSLENHLAKRTANTLRARWLPTHPSLRFGIFAMRVSRRYAAIHSSCQCNPRSQSSHQLESLHKVLDLYCELQWTVPDGSGPSAKRKVRRRNGSRGRYGSPTCNGQREAFNAPTQLLQRVGQCRSANVSRVHGGK